MMRRLKVNRLEGFWLMLKSLLSKRPAFACNQLLVLGKLPGSQAVHTAWVGTGLGFVEAEGR